MDMKTAIRARHALLFAGVALSGCGLGLESPPVAHAGGGREVFEGPVPRALCGPDDAAETGMQGRVSLADQLSGRSGSEYACNLERVGHFPGEGAAWQLAWYDDCAYYSTASLVPLPQNAELAGHPKPGQQFPGVNVIDLADPTNPSRTANLTTAAMRDPWESLKVNERRKLLGAINGGGGQGGPELDLYDVSDDCRQPQLLYSGAPDGNTIQGHGGNFSPDGQFYYGANLGARIYPMDIADPASPKLVGYFDQPTHDLSISEDGNRAYLANTKGNGLTIVDTSEIQARAPDPSMYVISELNWDDGANAQMTQKINIGGSNILLFVDENRAPGESGTTGTGAAGVPRLIDINDETAPFTISELRLEVHMSTDQEYLTTLWPETLTGVFGYNAHYCTPDDVTNTRIIACAYFQSGLRVLDVRDPYHPREIAYYNPPASPGYHPGSNFQMEGQCGATDWASAHSRIVLEREEIWFTTQCGGLHVVRFKRPLAELLAEAR